MVNNKQGFEGLTELKIHKKHKYVGLSFSLIDGWTSLCSGCTCVIYHGKDKPKT